MYTRAGHLFMSSKSKRKKLWKFLAPPLAIYCISIFFVIRKKEEMMKIFRPPLSPAPSKDPVEPEKEKGEAWCDFIFSDCCFCWCNRGGAYLAMETRSSESQSSPNLSPPWGLSWIQRTMIVRNVLGDMISWTVSFSVLTISKPYNTFSLHY